MTSANKYKQREIFLQTGLYIRGKSSSAGAILSTHCLHLYSQNTQEKVSIIHIEVQAYTLVDMIFFQCSLPNFWASLLYVSTYCVLVVE